MELLAPVGNQQALYAAVYNGADAVYLAGRKFNARSFADNFSDEQIIEAINFCHSYDVKVYITMNTILLTEEIEDAYQFALFLYQNNVDALIIQDFGLLELLHTRLPKLELHASTQMHAHNLEAIKVLKQAGISRVVLARETPLELINKICELDMEIEIFVYGALCVCYSGQCYFSGLTTNRSGNRGSCAQLCRLPYSLIKDGKEMKTDKYLLSPKDLSVIDELKKLQKVDSLKIEGRMKRAEYVAKVVQEFRKKITDFNYQCDEEGLKKLFNRGLTTGHIFNQRGFDLMNPYRPNHIGIEIGRVVSSRNNEVFIKLSKTLHQHDGLRIINDKQDFGFVANKILLNGLLVNHADPGDTISFKLENNFPTGAQVVCTSDIQQLKELAKSYEEHKYYLSANAYLEVKLNQPLKLTLTYKNIQVTQLSKEIAQPARNQAVNKEQLLKQLNKTGTSNFRFDFCDIYLDDQIFVSMSSLNDLRRSALELLTQKMLERPKKEINEYTFQPLTITKTNISEVYVSTLEQYEIAKAYPFQLISNNLETVNKDTHVGYQTLRVNENNYTLDNDYTVISELGQLNKSCHFKSSNAYFNIANAYALYFMYKHGVNLCEVFYELSNEQFTSMVEQYQHIYQTTPNLNRLVYGRRELMVSKYCAPNTYDTTNHQIKCLMCKQHQYQIKKGNEVFPLTFDDTCKMHILESKPLDLLAFIPSYTNGNYKLIFTIESSQETKKILDYYQQQLENNKATY